MPRRHLIVCVDCTDNLCEDKWKPLLDNYDCEVVESSEQALQIVATRRADAIVVACPVAAANLVMQLKTLRRETPVVLLGDGGISRCAPHAITVAAESVPDIPSLLVFLREGLATPGKFSVISQRYQIGHLRWPFSVLADRSGKVVGFEGRTVALGKGGMYGKMAATLQLGETVLVEFPNAPEEPPLRAKVLFQHDDVYGFRFER